MSGRSLRFGGLMVPARGWGRLSERAIELERLGFDLVAIDDHVGNPQDPTQPWLEAWTTLAAIAVATDTIRLGPLVANTVLRHPGLLARQAHTVDQISRGRLELAVGSGYAPLDHRVVQQPLWDGRERAERFGESVAILDALLQGARPPEGRHYDVGDLWLAPPSAQRPRPSLTVAAHGPRALDIAARFADRWVSFGGWGVSTARSLELTRRRLDHLRERCVACGRLPEAVAPMLLAGSAAVNTDPIWTSVGAFEDFVGQFAEIGVETFVFYWPPRSVSRDVDPAVVEEVVADVVPRLQRRAGS